MNKKVNVQKGKQGFQRSTKHVNPTASLDSSQKKSQQLPSDHTTPDSSSTYDDTHNTFQELLGNKGVDQETKTSNKQEYDYNTPSSEGPGYSGMLTVRKIPTFGRRWHEPVPEGPETKREVVERIAQGGEPRGSAEQAIRQELIDNYVNVNGVLMRKATQDTVVQPTRAQRSAAERAKREKEAPYGYDVRGYPITEPPQ
jgi:hypothetical protein